MEKKDRPVLAAREKGVYCLLLFILQMVKLPICYTGPGSGRYSLPTCVGHRGHDPTKKCMPQYSFGKRLENPSKFFQSAVWIVIMIFNVQCFARIAVLDQATTLIQLPLGLVQEVLHPTPS